MKRAPLLLATLLVFACAARTRTAPSSPAVPRPAAQSLAATSLEPFSLEEGGPYGYREPGGRVVIPPSYQMAEPFTPGGIAAVMDEQGWAYIDRSGRVLVRPFDFDNGPDPFVEGLARCVADGKYGFFKADGEVVIAPRFTWAEPFSEGLAAVCEGCAREYLGEHWTMRGGRWGYIDRRGVVAIPLDFDRAESFTGGRATVEKQGGRYTIDHTGRIVETPDQPR